MVIMKHRTIMLNDSFFISLWQFLQYLKKAFSGSFCKEKESEIFHSHFYQKLALNTKKSDICCCDFNPLAVKYFERGGKSLQLLKFQKLRKTSLDKLYTNICPAISQNG